jgi:hypothetical protein
MRTRSLVFSLLPAALLLAAAPQTRPVEPDQPARWWKGNLHTHTFWSDGDDFPDMVAEWYRDHGYHFLGLSEHNLLSQGERWDSVEQLNRKAETDAVAKYRRRFGDSWVERRDAASGKTTEIRLKTLDEVRSLVEERGRFLLISSEEITGASADGRALHMNAQNLVEPLPYEVGSTLRETLVRNLQQVAAAARRTGRPVLLHVNHPNYKWGLAAEDLAAVADLRFFEVWNGVDGDNDPGDGVRPSTDEIWDIANTLRLVRYKSKPLYGLAWDDSHDHHGNKTRALPGRAWVMVRARHLSPESILRALERGDFYASTGVTLADVAYDKAEKRLSLRIEGEPGARYTTRFLGTRRGARVQGRPRVDKDGQPVETTLDYRSEQGPQVGEVLAESEGLTPSYRLKGDELYVRAVVTSDRPVAVPTTEFRYQRAWTQPVGW